MDLNAAIDRCYSRHAVKPVSASPDEHGITLNLSGSLDLQYSKELLELLTIIVEGMDKKGRLLIDLSDVNYISSTGVGALSSALILARKRDLGLVLRNLQPKVRSVFDLLGLMKFFDVVDKRG